MSTLLLVLAGPMQSWGVEPRMEVRPTERVPTKSGVIGLVAGAMGFQRDEEPAHLFDLRMGVRIDVPGKLMRDFQTYSDVMSADTKTLHHRGTSMSYFLSDAVFLVGLEGDKTILTKAFYALATPVFPPFLGRGGFIPSPAPFLPNGFTSKRLEQALVGYVYPQKLFARYKFSKRVEYVIEQTNSHHRIFDQPESLVERRFLSRGVERFYADEGKAFHVS
ncbi:MAG: type I-E CRISPR-associated protein Cas5/CasD [Trueperaceae bacterium]